MFIKEIAKELNITARTIRYYEEIGILNTKRLSNNYRYFDAENLDKLKFLVRARNLGFSLEHCRELIALFNDKNRKSEEVRGIAKRKLESIDSQIKDLKNLKESLEWLVLKCPGNSKPECPIIDELSKK